jgi:hypothetical protein
MKTAEKTAIVKQFGISEQEVKVILQAIEEFNAEFMPTVNFLERYFLNNIKPIHYLIVGYLIGANQATVQTLDEIQNSFLLCQRQN